MFFTQANVMLGALNSADEIDNFSGSISNKQLLIITIMHPKLIFQTIMEFLHGQTPEPAECGLFFAVHSLNLNKVQQHRLG